VQAKSKVSVKCEHWRMGQVCYNDRCPEDFIYVQASDIEQDSRGSSGNSTDGFGGNNTEGEKEILTPENEKFLRQLSQARELVNNCWILSFFLVQSF
jgi:hypothetical protein